VIDARPCGDGALHRRIFQGTPFVPADPGGSKTGDQRVPRGRGQDFYEHGGIDFSGMARAPCCMRRITARIAARRVPPQSPAGRQELLLTNEVSFSPQDQEALLEPIERRYSRTRSSSSMLNESIFGLGGLRRRRRVAGPILDKSVNELRVAEAPIWRDAEGAGGAASVCANHDRRSRPQLVTDRLLGKWLDQAGRCRKGAQDRDRDQPSNCAHIFAGRIFRRGKVTATSSALRPKRNSMRWAVGATSSDRRSRWMAPQNHGGRPSSP